MGCCGSKEEHDETDENQPLLNDNISGDNRVNYGGMERIDQQKEQEFWDNIVDKTTQNLIDISSSQTDPLQYNDIQDRESKYKTIMDGLKSVTTLKQQLISNNNGSIIDTLTNAKPNGGMTDGEVDWLYQTMDEVQDALQRIEIEPVGEMVVHLTMTDSSIKSY
ncbi:hypothetical protein K501DRAFT_232193 [Backusella circina FSU 941]|nr:hypothetical protein K501DRAFT_232193 [Backusella circina FSU 941]